LSRIITKIHKVSVIDAVVIGGGPAGSAVGRLLASWGHSVRILTKPSDRSRGLGESLPPSTKKLLDAIGVLATVERAGFYKTTGNSVWWASRECRVETFDPEGRVFGYQVFRPDFDRLLLNHAAEAGAGVNEAAVRGVDLRDARGEGRAAPPAIVEFERDGRRETVECRFVIDCSGRAGVVAKRYRRFEQSHRMYALVGVWTGRDGRAKALEQERRAKALAERSNGRSDPTHTLVETYEDGWAWSVPIAPTTRHVGTMVDGTSPRVTSGRVLADAYRAEIDKTIHVARLVDGATLDHVFACDASLYASDRYAGAQFLLAGAAGSFIDPLSSFGVKKALASAWVGAIAVHTCLTHPERQASAIQFFERWERDVYATHLRRSRDFARAAHAQHPHPFWATRAAAADHVEDGDLDENALGREPEVRAAFEALKRSDDVKVTRAEGVNFVMQPVIRGREIVLEDAIPLPLRSRGGIRFLHNVDLVALADLARQHARVADLIEAYSRLHGPVPFPNVIGALSFLVARGILAQRV
jgi:2-polyprenyl-6-methoxyphenol hydroxylase-like FAD-dependent oxidoreductase